MYKCFLVITEILACNSHHLGVSIMSVSLGLKFETPALGILQHNDHPASTVSGRKKHFVHKVSHEGLLNMKPEKATFTWYYETVST
jgi:hypothetical protein